MYCPPSLWFNQGFQLLSQGYNLLSRPKAEEVNTDHNPLLCHISSHEVTEKLSLANPLYLSSSLITPGLPATSCHLLPHTSVQPTLPGNPRKQTQGKWYMDRNCSSASMKPRNKHMRLFITSLECFCKVSTIW